LIHFPNQYASASANALHITTIYINVVNILHQVFLPVNNTVESFPFEMTFSSLSSERYEWYKQLEATYQVHKDRFASSEKEIEDIKSMFLETNAYLLYVTGIVSFFHLLFDFLAFKNDVSFWRSTRTMAGLSVRTVAMNAVCEFIILLYLFDNETSILVLGSVGVGLIINLWKMFRAYSIKSYANSSTNEFDKVAMKSLGILFVPIILGYSAYSLIYQQHTGWYAWALSSLVSMVYSFGFVRMTPQLFINYKMKSVSHLPWRAFTYKAMNTFIDDLFAFIIKMPTMHRLSVFRDDIVFLIYLYQRWIYPVDVTRVNEYGQSGEADAGNAAAEETTKTSNVNKLKKDT